MLNYDLEELSSREIENKINTLNNQILVPGKELSIIYSLDYFKNQTEEERKKVLTSFNLEDSFDKLNLYFLLSPYFEEESTSQEFSETLTPIIEDANSVITKLNDIVTKKLEEINLHNEKIQSEITFYEKLKIYISEEFSFEKEAYEELATFIIQSSLPSEEKIALSIALSKKLIENKQNIVSKTQVGSERTYTSTEINSFEEDLIETEEQVTQISPEETISDYRKEQLALAKSKYEQYKSTIAGNPFGDPEEVYGIFTLDDVNIDELSMDKFAILLNISVSSINDLSLSDDDIRAYADVLRNIDMMYTEAVRQDTIALNERIEQQQEQNLIESLSKTFDRISSKLQKLFAICNASEQTLENKYYEYLTELQQKLDPIKARIDRLEVGALTGTDELEKNLKVLEEEIEKELKTKEKIVIKPVPIKAFVLLDNDDESQKSFLYEDLLGENPFIETQAIVGNDVSSDDINYQQNISKLINELIVDGKCEYMNSVNTSYENYADKIESIIYKKDKDGKVVRDEKTPLWRIRPTPRSNVRFVEKKVILPKNSEILHQVKEIILKYLPNVIISEEEDFPLIINFGCGIKRADEDLYTTAYRRIKDRTATPLALFYEKGNYGLQNNKAVKLKNKLSANDCELLEEYISSSLQSFYEMSKKDSTYDFSFIDEMAGDRKNVLQ